MSDEVFDVVTAEGRDAGRRKLRVDVHRDGDWSFFFEESNRMAEAPPRYATAGRGDTKIHTPGLGFSL